ncbi:C-terminal binding protein [Desulfovibrio sp. OttesenSCG-928-I05]|nr:C-terminal binding protein [Desulfovibrio sp. OttesenSCG-928-I05]
MANIVFVDSHITGSDHPCFATMRETFEKAGHVFFQESCKSREEVLEKTAHAHAIITTYTPLDREILRNAPELKMAMRNAIGYEILDIAAGTELGIPICNIPDYCTEEVATHTMALILACARKLKPSAELVRAGTWKIVCGYPIDRLSTQTLGLIGFGRIAKLVAGYAKAFGMTIIAHDPFIPADVFAEHGVEGVSLDDLYARSDIISVGAPLTSENRHMINAASIAKMKDGVILVNTGRGPLIATDDLIAALESGKVKAAGLDVLEEEPLRDADAKILSLDNVILTSHIGYDSQQAIWDNFDKAAKTVLATLAGELPYNVLNLKELEK